MITMHHVGLTVRDAAEARAFFEGLLGIPPLFEGRLSRPYLGETVGLPGVEIDGVLFELPGGVRIELLDYRLPDRQVLPDDTRHPGNVHLCLDVDDIEAVWTKAIELGARPVRAAGPTTIDSGPNAGTRAAYMRILGGITMELFQRAPAA